MKYSWFLLMLASCGENIKVLKIETIKLSDPNQIISVDDSLVQPILYQNLIDFNKLSVEQSKEKFIATVMPAILIAKYHLETDRNTINKLIENKEWTVSDSTFYHEQMNLYKADDINDLLVRMKTHPNSITLAQAAVESGWGSSRFFREANNLFGIWAYNSDEPRIPANQNDVYLRKYNDVSESIEDYFVTLGRARPYQSFRKVRTESDDINDLLPHLKHYSQRGLAYISQLKIIIDQNDFTKYDHYQLDPRYFVEK